MRVLQLLFLGVLCLNADSYRFITAGVLNQKGVESFKEGQYDNAMQEFSQGCFENDYTGCYNAALLSRYGRYGNDKDINYFTAKETFRLSCEHNVYEACYELAGMFRQGLGLIKDSEKEQHYYKLACGHGIKKACAFITK